MMGIRSLWAQRRGRVLVVVMALALVAGLIVGGVALYRTTNDDVWVADESYTFDVCSLVESAELVAVMDHVNEADSDPEPVQLSHRLDYVSEVEGYGDTCGYRDRSTGGAAVVNLTVGPTAGSVAVDEYWSVSGGDTDLVADVGDEAAFYEPSSGSGGSVVAHQGDVLVELELAVYGTAMSDEATRETRKQLVRLTESVLEQLPEEYVMPGDIVDVPCGSLRSAATRLFDEEPTYARSFGQPNAESPQRVRCEFATGQGRHVAVTIKANHPGVREQIQGLEETPESFDEVDAGTSDVYRDENLLHYIVGSKQSELVEVRLSQHGVEREPGESEPAPEGEELERLIDLGERALPLGT